MSAAADWFHNAVLDGLQRLMVLRLDGCPPADTVQLTATVWIDSLWAAGTWSEAVDLVRLRAAFASLAASATRWPSPAELRQQLPVRQVDQPRLVAPFCPPSPERRAALLAQRERLRAATAASVTSRWSRGKLRADDGAVTPGDAAPAGAAIGNDREQKLEQ